MSAQPGGAKFMKLRWKIILVLAVVFVIGVFLWLRPNDRDRKPVEETRLALRQQGFKTDLTDFDFSTSDELRARERALTMFGGRGQMAAAAGLNSFDLMTALGSDSALVIWKQPAWTARAGQSVLISSGGVPQNSWTIFRETMDQQSAELDAACAAALSGPIRFDLNPGQGSQMLLPHLSALRNLVPVLGSRAMLELHDRNQDAAWTNLLAATRLVTAWETEPVEVSHLVRIGCAGIAFSMTWQTLQARDWSDAQLAQLQREWESVDYFRGLPETAAFTRASLVAMCQLERQQPSGPGMPLKDLSRNPKYIWPELRRRWGEARYRHHGSYEDEKALLLFYRDRELELRRAVQAPNWSEMRPFPGVTNLVLFQSKHRSRLQVMWNMRQMNLATQRFGQSFLGRVAEAEARRRILITAIALERYRGRHGSYPILLLELVPELLGNVPTDFMDGQPLRYRLTDDGHFVLYSIGLDCVDNGGEMQRPRARGTEDEIPTPFAFRQPPDLVWPRPATDAEAAAVHRKELQARKESVNQSEHAEATAQWEHSARRQARVEMILATEGRKPPAEPQLRGRALSELLRNESNAGTNRPRLDEMLTLKPVVTGAEPETVTFEVPVAYDAVTNLGELFLLVDPVEDNDSDEGCAALDSECRRAPDGNCLLVWNTIYESPGKHALQLGLTVNELPADKQDFTGPIRPWVLSNLCQFSLASAQFDLETGATLHAKLPEPRATYSVELTSTAGERLRTLTGSTSNGILKVFWDLKDNRGRRCTNEEFGSVFHVTLTDSGRSQTMKGP